jgi:hypothetical protein
MLVLVVNGWVGGEQVFEEHGNLTQIGELDLIHSLCEVAEPVQS